MDVVKQSAALCLLRLFRTSTEIIPGGEWTSRIIHLLNDQHMGVVTAATSFIDALVKKNPDEYKGCISLAVSRLSRVLIWLKLNFPLLLTFPYVQIVTASYTDLQDYTYYFVPAPWLSVKLLRLLQNYSPPGTFILCSPDKSKILTYFWVDRWPGCQGQTDRVSRDNIEQSPGASQVQEGPTLQCQKCCAVRSNKSHHSHGQVI